MNIDHQHRSWLRPAHRRAGVWVATLVGMGFTSLLIGVMESDSLRSHWLEIVAVGVVAHFVARAALLKRGS